MTGRNTILTELKELNSSLPDTNAPVFSVPDDYFENFAATMLARIKGDNAKNEISELSPLLAGISKKLPFAVPANYFKSLEPNVYTEEENSSFLTDKSMPFAVPSGYFENLPNQLVSQVRRPAKVVSMYRKSWTRMAVAAMTAGIILVSGLFYFNQSSNSPAVDSQAWVTSKLDNVSDKGLDEFIKATDVNPDQEIASTVVKPQEVKAMLSDVSLSEMDAFLEQLPTDDDELSVIN